VLQARKNTRKNIGGCASNHLRLAGICTVAIEVAAARDMLSRASITIGSSGKTADAGDFRPRT